MRGASSSSPCLVLLVLLAACATVGSPTSAPADYKTLSFAILEDYDKGTDLAAVDRDFALFAELDIPTWRGSFGWDDYEPAAGRYDLRWLHDFISLAETRGITLRPYLAFTPAWAAGGTDTDGQPWNQPPREPAAWAAFVRAIAAEAGHHRNVPSLEIYNEQNVTQWWEGTRQEYAETLRVAADAIRRTRRARGMPPLQVVAGGLVFPDLDWIEEVCAEPGAARSFDVLAVHAYPETWTPPGTTVENYLGEGFGGAFLPGADQACGAKRVWINETGYATTPGRTERDQAAWWARAIAVFAAEPRVESIGIYEIRDLALDKPAIGDAPNYHLGLVTTDGRRKLAFATVDLLTDLLGTSALRITPGAFAIAVHGGGGELHYRAFTRADGVRVLIVWDRTAASRIEIRPDTAGAMIEYSLEGRETTRHATDGGIEVPLEAGVPRIFVQRR